MAKRKPKDKIKVTTPEPTPEEEPVRRSKTPKEPKWVFSQSRPYDWLPKKRTK